MSHRNYTQDEINERYEKSLIEFMDRFQSYMEMQNKLTGSTHGFVVLMIRDASEGNVDVAHNFSKDEDLQRVMELALDTIKKGNKKQTSNP